MHGLPPSPTTNLHFPLYISTNFSRNTVMIIAGLNYSLPTDFVIGHNAVGWHSEHWHWLLVGILCWGERSETLCKDLFAQFAILFAQYCNHTLIFHHPRHAKQTTKHLLHTADTSRLLSLQHNDQLFSKGNVCRSPAAGKERGMILYQFCSWRRGLSWTETSLET